VAIGLPNLTLLDLYDTGIGAKGVRALVRRLKHLRTLDLTHNDIGIAVVKAIADASALAGLRDLRLAYNKLGDEGATALSLADHLTQLELLDLRNIGIGPSGVEDLLEEAWLSRLECLLLDANRVGNTAAEALAKATHMTRLKALRLRGTGFGRRGRGISRPRRTSPACASSSSTATRSVTKASRRCCRRPGPGSGCSSSGPAELPTRGCGCWPARRCSPGSPGSISTATRSVTRACARSQRGDSTP
jgi:hypothetical protein